MSSFLDKKLAEIVAQLDRGERSPEVPVRMLLAWVGASRRGWSVVHSIKRALERAALMSVPDFESVHIDTPIRFALNKTVNSTPPEQVTGPLSPQVQKISPREDVVDAVVANDPTMRISRFIDANVKLVTVAPDNTVRDAVTKMMFRDFSQLPAMTNQREVHGVR